MLTKSATVDQMLPRINFLSPAQGLALANCLENMTVQDLLEMPTVQTLADVIEEKQRERYAKEWASLSERKRKTQPDPDTYMFNQAPIPLRDIGSIAYKLLRYVHRMFDPIPDVALRAEL